ncbi:peptidoglycan DD-metalloendopeptidase family protein [Robertmurraya sp. FSL R5-0851]|uniref:peptidoglycan DD-metalloendopeptidase family protein n=1 Tax=Robertmurraya sp. FSL R5-0851 TaxID=2921584 RepID=UPI0030FA845E
MLPPEREQEEKSQIRKFAEDQAKRQGRKVVKKLAKKGGKLAAKLAKIAVKKFAMVLGKLLAWIVGTVGLPIIGIALAIITALVVVSLAWSFLFGTGEGLAGEDKKLHQYIVERANATVNMNSSIEKPYRVPEKLIAATVQIDAFSKNEDIREVIKKMATALAPEFEYGRYNEWTETQVTVCEDGSCKTGDIKRDDKYVDKLEHVDYWNGSTSFTYTAHISAWKSSTVTTYKTVKETTTKKVVEEIQVPVQQETCERKILSEDPPKYQNICTTKTVYVTKLVTKYVDVETERQVEIKTTTKTRNQYFTSQKTQRTDYGTFDNILNSYGLGINDKKLIEANYLFMGGTIEYSEWLSTNSGGGSYGGGFIGFDGIITPGGGVPPQFMPYYLSAEKKYGVHWYTLAGIHFVETGFSTHPTMLSSAGAVGHMQFMPATWVGWSYNIGGGRVSPSVDITSLAVIAQGRGYGVDGNGDGKADPWDVEDSVHTAANYLSKNNYANDPRGAVWHYNHAEWYVNKVLNAAEGFKNAATYQANGDKIPPLQPGSFMKPAVGRNTSGFGNRSGGMHYGADIAPPVKGALDSQVVASADGVVSRSAYSGTYGHVVYIKHNIGGQAYETVYAHLQGRAVTLGQTVKQGQFLGLMGDTGDSDGVHLHFEVHLGAWSQNKANAINPALVVPF